MARARQLLAVLAGFVLLAGNASGMSATASHEAADFHRILVPRDEHTRTSNDIVSHLRYRHYLNLKFDDQLSARVLDDYLAELDGERLYFLAADIAEMEIFRDRLDEALLGNDLGPAFKIFNRYQQRLVERLVFLRNRLDRGLQDMDFEAVDWLETDRKRSPWAATVAELDELWQKRLKETVLSLKLTGKTLAEINTILDRRYSDQLNRGRQTNSDDAFQVFMTALTGAFDPHTQYFSPSRTEDFYINMSLALEGIGVILQRDDEYTMVVRLLPAGPADKGGELKPADRIVGVGQGRAGEIVNVVGWRIDEVVNLIRGPKGTTVRLEVIPAEAVDKYSTRVIEIVRNTVELEEQEAKARTMVIRRDGRDYRLGVVGVESFYMDFEAFNGGEENYKSTANDVRLLLKKLVADGVEGVVVDLRDNGGGSLQEANLLTGLFIAYGPTVQIKSADGRVDILQDTDMAVAYGGPLVVLVNRLSASASEIFAAAIQDYRRGVVVGEQTYGKGTVQSLLPVYRGQLSATAAKYYRITGASTQLQGVIPDILYPSLYTTDDIGESTLPGALPWDSILALPYRPVSDFTALLPKLLASHEDRLSRDPAYDYIVKRLEFLRKNRLNGRVTLREENRRMVGAARDHRRLEIENDYRRAMNLPVLAKEEVNWTAGLPDQGDPLLAEGGQVLVDLISLIRSERPSSERAAGEGL